MAATQPRARTRLAIQLDPALRRKLESAASQRGFSLSDYVLGVLHDAVHGQSPGDARDGAPVAQPAASPDFTSAPEPDTPQYYQSDRLKALARKRRVTLEDIAGILPALPIPPGQESTLPGALRASAPRSASAGYQRVGGS
jgi:hypothetical protein